MKPAETSPGPRARDRRTTRHAVIAAASRLMRLHGYHATSLDEVLRESGVGKGNFYHHFRSKEELGHAILDEIIQEFIEQTLDPCFSADAGDPLRQVRCFLDRIVEIHRRANCVGGCPLGNLASELSDVHEGFRARLAEIFSAWRERLTQVLTDARASGAIVAECAPEAVAQFIVASLEGGILLAKLTKDITVLEQCVGEISRYLRTYEVAG